MATSLKPMLGTSWRQSSLGRVMMGATGFAVFVALWEIFRLLEVLPPLWAPGTTDIARALWTGATSGVYAGAVGETLLEWMLGLLIAAVIAVVWGMLIGASPVVAACSRIVIRVLRPIPSVALIPVAILAAGFGLRMIVILVVFASLWPILFNTLYATREVPVQYVETARSLGLGPLEIQRRVVAVAILPGVTTGLRVSASIALVVAISAELVTGSGGLGGHILEMRLAGRTPETYAAVVLGGIVGVVISIVFTVLQKRLLRWSPDNREAAA
jgi:ABC-type nitrate/sulfonate/bicarbonate transport system permease component